MNTRGECDGTVRALEKIPSLASLYAKAIGVGALRALPPLKRRVPQELPSLCLEVSDVQLHREDDRRLREVAGGRAGEKASAEYLHVLGFPLAMSILTDPEFPLTAMGMVHLSQIMDYADPLSFDDRVCVRASARNLARHKAGTSVELVLEVVDTENTVRFRSLSVYLAKGIFLTSKGDAEEQGKAENKGSAGKSASGKPEVPARATARWRLGPETGRRWAEVSGDFNPIHLSSISAKMAGMPTAIAHGMYSASRILESSLPASVEGNFHFEVSFAAPMRLPAKVEVAIESTDLPELKKGWGRKFFAWNARSGKMHLWGELLPSGK